LRTQNGGNGAIVQKAVLTKRQTVYDMAEKKKCEYCDKEAIGFQSLEGSFAWVCRDHADSLLLELKPGEKKVYGVCVLERYE